MDCFNFHKSTNGLVKQVERMFDSDTYIFFVCGSYGDVLPNLALLNSFSKKNKECIGIVINERWAPLFKRFDGFNVKTIKINEKDDNRLRMALLSANVRFFREKGVVFPLLIVMHPWLTELILNQHVSDFEVKRALLGLPKGELIDYGFITEERGLEIESYLASKGVVKGKSVILSFSTNSNDTPSFECQKLIINLVKELGFTPVLNVAKTSDAWEKGKVIKADSVVEIEVPCDAPFETIEYAGYHIGSMHGLTAILGSRKTDAKLATTIYTSNVKVENIGRLIESNSLNLERLLAHDLKNFEYKIPIDVDVAEIEGALIKFLN